MQEIEQAARLMATAGILVPYAVGALMLLGALMLAWINR